MSWCSAEFQTPPPAFPAAIPSPLAVTREKKRRPVGAALADGSGRTAGRYQRMITAPGWPLMPPPDPPLPKVGAETVPADV